MSVSLVKMAVDRYAHVPPPPDTLRPPTLRPSGMNRSRIALVIGTHGIDNFAPERAQAVLEARLSAPCVLKRLAGALGSRSAAQQFATWSAHDSSVGQACHNTRQATVHFADRTISLIFADD